MHVSLLCPQVIVWWRPVASLIQTNRRRCRHGR
jgi:hypothetical protein